MKITRSEIRNLIMEELATTRTKSRLSDVSVDDQIDSMLIRFEEQSVMQESYLNSLALLLEAEPEDKGKKPKADTDEEDEEDKTASSEDVEIDSGADPVTPKIDIDAFSSKVARLVENFPRLLDIATVILMRSRNFLEENYGKAVADEFEESLDRNHGLEISPKDNVPPRPAAVGAGPG